MKSSKGQGSGGGSQRGLARLNTRAGVRLWENTTLHPVFSLFLEHLTGLFLG